MAAGTLVVAAIGAVGAASARSDAVVMPSTSVATVPAPEPSVLIGAVDEYLARYAPVEPRRTPRAELSEHQPRSFAPARRTITLAFGGDILLHTPLDTRAVNSGDPAGAFTEMLSGIAPEVTAADLAVCHLETPLSPDGSQLSGYPVFNGHPAVATAIARTGWDGCSTASNHSLDKGPGGVAATLGVLDAAGVRHAGSARDASEDAAPVLYDVDGVTVGHVSATYGLNGFVMPADQPWLVDLIDPVDGVLAEAAAARAAGARVVVVSIHAGEEYQVTPTAYQRAVAQALLASPDVDLVVGHHAHVVQPVEIVGDKAVVFGMGNLLSGQTGRPNPATADGVVVTVTLDVGAVATVDQVAATPTWVEPGTFRVIPVQRALADPATAPDRRAVLEASLARTTGALGPQVTLVP